MSKDDLCIVMDQFIIPVVHIAIIYLTVPGVYKDIRRPGNPTYGPLF